MDLFIRLYATIYEPIVQQRLAINVHSAPKAINERPGFDNRGNAKTLEFIL